MRNLQGWQLRKGGVRELQINSLFCKPVCKPDAAGRHETGETEPAERDGICPVCRGHHARGRRPETAETHVVWLITQRSRVQIPPPLLISAGQGPFLSGRGPLRDRECDQRKVLVRYAAAGQVRRAGTQRDSAEPGRRHRLRSLDAFPEVAQDPPLLTFALNCENGRSGGAEDPTNVYSAAGENAWPSIRP